MEERQCIVTNNCPRASRCKDQRCGKKEVCNHCGNFVTLTNKRFCLHHGLTDFYKNGKCKICVKYQRLESFYKNREKKLRLEKTLNVTERKTNQ